MRYRGLKSVLLLAPAAFAFVIGIPGAAEVTSAPIKWETDLRNANDKEVAAFMVGDLKALSGLWSDDFLVTNPLNKVATKAEVLSMVRGGMLSFKSYQRHIEYIHRYGETAVVIGNENVEWAGKMPLAGHLLPLRFTAVWLHTGKHWLQVARHANVVPKI
ncbi:MAG: hypothetical protein NVS3B5_15760 [Sphingomicrobium sp.]